MSIQNLDKFFKPRHVAVIGASERPNTIGNALITNLIQANFPGAIYPVNPRYKTIGGLPSFASVTDIDEPPDLAVITTPLAACLPVVETCIQKGIGGLVIISSGGKETGETGLVQETEIKTTCLNHGMRVIGPNCMGIICTQSKLNASFARNMPSDGNLAVISQSGALCSAILDNSFHEGIGFSHFISIGAMVDVDFGDLIDYLGLDAKVKSIVLYIENIPDMRHFMSAARRVSRIKPIVVLKAGRSAAGARAAASHTGAMAGEDGVYRAAFKRAGIVQVDTIEELFDCAELMAKQPVPKGSRIAIVTNGGGAGVMAADALGDHGLEPTRLPPEMMQQLNNVLPPYWSHGNPIDILGDATTERWRQAVQICRSASTIDALIIIYLPPAMTEALPIAEVVVESLKPRTGFPVFAVWMGAAAVEAARGFLNKNGIPTYDTPERAVTAFVHMYHYSCNLEMLQQIPPRQPTKLQFNQDAAKTIISNALQQKPFLLTETESKELLQAYGIPTNTTYAAHSPQEAIHLADRIGYPVAMKILSKDIPHKTEANGIRLNISSPEAVEKAFKELLKSARNYHPQALIQGVTIQAMVTETDCELIIGCKNHDNLGPAVLFGFGGTMTEIIHDIAVGLPPLNKLLARRLMQETKIFKMLKGHRNQTPADLDLLDEILIRVSQLACDFPEIKELDINPLVLVKGRAIAVDARIQLKPTRITAPQHLVISPYPSQYEAMTETKENMMFHIRPIMPEDASLLVTFFQSLSYRSIYNRFFRPIKELSPQMLALLTQIDYDRDMALIAYIKEGQTTERMLGMARIMADGDLSQAEFAVLIGDPWQGQGIGAALLEKLITIAGERCIKHLWGNVLNGNTQMLALGHKLGFLIKPGPDSEQYEMHIDLASPKGVNP